MSRINLDNLADDDAALYVGRRRLKFVTGDRLHKTGAESRSNHAVSDEIIRHSMVEEKTAGDGFNPSLNSSRHEREWILTYLGDFYVSQMITDVLARVKGGKEANVYCCAAHPNTGLDLIAAKLFRPSMMRNLRNDARYRQNRDLLDDRGKVVRDRRALLAVRKKTGIGQDIRHTSWLEYEHRALSVLFEAGADVPEPIARGNNTILMGYIGDVSLPAPALNEMTLPRNSVASTFERLLWNVELMLSLDIIHGDLSAYNVLYWDGECKIIDFPQMVDPRTNPDAYDIFQRDVTRLCEYFARYGIRANGQQIARSIWERKGPGRNSFSEGMMDDLAL